MEFFGYQSELAYKFQWAWSTDWVAGEGLGPAHHQGGDPVELHRIAPEENHDVAPCATTCPTAFRTTRTGSAR
jgi:hypothetical protein